MMTGFFKFYYGYLTFNYILMLLHSQKFLNVSEVRLDTFVIKSHIETYKS